MNTTVNQYTGETGSIRKEVHLGLDVVGMGPFPSENSTLNDTKKANVPRVFLGKG